MKLVVGLGNPGKEYQLTRHNAGFLALDSLTSDWKLEKKWNAEVAEISVGDKKVLLARPQTFMNLSGAAVLAILDFYKLSADELVVVHDDVDLPFGRIRVVRDSGHGGQKGVADVMSRLATKNFTRVKIGVRNELAERADTSDFVLSKFSTDEQKKLPEICDAAAAAVEKILRDGVEAAAAEFNGQNFA